MNQPIIHHQPLDVLKHYWGYDAFRPGQEDIVNAVLAGQDTLALMATGGGKSICFQVPALCQEGMALVISPLIALMKDQVLRLHQLGIAAVAIHSGLNHYELDTLLENAAQGVYKFLYMSPERLTSDLFLARLPRMNISLLVVDEAHCISEWGHEFRPAYRQIASFRENLTDVPCLALTATATADVLADIEQQLVLVEPKVFVNPFWRGNLSYSIVDAPDKERRLLQMLQRLNGPVIIYVRMRRKAEELAVYLNDSGYQALPYHAGLDNEVKQDHAARFVKNQVRIIVATSAFGMGIDKPDVQLVIHWDAPPTPEAYFQEVGRAGRNGDKAYGVWLYQANEFDGLRAQLDAVFPPESDLREVYGQLCSFLKLPVGTQPETAIPVDLTTFCRNFKRNYTATWHAMKRLEEAGYWTVIENDPEPERFKVVVDNLVLYELELKHAGLAPLLKAFKRIYGGAMFTDYVPLLRPPILSGLRVTEGQLTHWISQLVSLEAIHYVPQYQQPLIWLAQPRLLADQMRINMQRFEQRKATEAARINFLEDLAADPTMCRQQALVAYFNPTERTEPCGICDNCLRKQKTAQPDYKSVKETILELLHQPMTPQEVVALLHNLPQDMVLSAIRRMIDQHEIDQSATGQIFISK